MAIQAAEALAARRPPEAARFPMDAPINPSPSLLR